MLVREWHGTKHQVSVLKDGFVYRSKTVWFAVTDRTDHYRHPMVGSAVLRPEIKD